MLRPLSLLFAVVLLPALVYTNHESLTPERHAIRDLRARTTWDSVFSVEQASRGQTTYVKTCQRCHQASLGGGDVTPALTGGAFMSGWNGLALSELHNRIRTSMPPDSAITYGRTDISDVIAYVLSVNGFPAGKTTLAFDGDSLKDIVFTAAKP